MTENLMERLEQLEQSVKRAAETIAKVRAERDGLHARIEALESEEIDALCARFGGGELASAEAWRRAARRRIGSGARAWWPASSRWASRCPLAVSPVQTVAKRP